MRVRIVEMESPLGWLTLGIDRGVLRAVEFGAFRGAVRTRIEARFAGATLTPARGGVDAVSRLQDYFKGDLQALERIEVAAEGTAFQQRVWGALRGIVAGSVTSYRELARRIGQPQATRAVGSANARNPIPIVIPCHRVIAADGSLGGYSSGLERKRWLLCHERVEVCRGALASRQSAG